MGIKVRNRELSEALARRALADDYQAIEPGVTVIIPSRDDYIRAAHYLQDLKSGLRSADALHIAIAVNSGVTRLLTLDRAFIKSQAGLTSRSSCVGRRNVTSRNGRIPTLRLGVPRSRPRAGSLTSPLL